MNKFDFLKELASLEVYRRRTLIEMAINTIRLYNLISFGGIKDDYSKAIVDKVHDFNEIFFTGCSDKYVKTIVHRIGNNDLFRQYMNAIKCFKEIIDKKTTSSIADVEKSLANAIKDIDNDVNNSVKDNHINDRHSDRIDSMTLFIMM